MTASKSTPSLRSLTPVRAPPLAPPPPPRRRERRPAMLSHSRRRPQIAGCPIGRPRPSSSSAFTPTRCSRESGPAHRSRTGLPPGWSVSLRRDRARSTPRRRRRHHRRPVRERHGPGACSSSGSTGLPDQTSASPSPGSASSFGSTRTSDTGSRSCCPKGWAGGVSTGRQRAACVSWANPHGQAGRRPVRRHPPGLGLHHEQAGQAERPVKHPGDFKAIVDSLIKGLPEARGHRPVQARRRERHEGLSDHLRLRSSRTRRRGRCRTCWCQGPLRLLDHRSGELGDLVAGLEDAGAGDGFSDHQGGHYEVGRARMVAPLPVVGRR